jgi:hypothetical protein
MRLLFVLIVVAFLIDTSLIAQDRETSGRQPGRTKKTPTPTLNDNSVTNRAMHAHILSCGRRSSSCAAGPAHHASITSLQSTN